MTIPEIYQQQQTRGVTRRSNWRASQVLVQQRLQPGISSGQAEGLGHRQPDPGAQALDHHQSTHQGPLRQERTQRQRVLVTVRSHPGKLIWVGTVKDIQLTTVFIFARAWPCWVTSIPSRLSFWGVAPWLNPTTKMWSKEREALTATPLPTVGVGLKRQSQMLHRCKTRKPRAKTSNQVRSPTKLIQSANYFLDKVM